MSNSQLLLLEAQPVLESALDRIAPTTKRKSTKKTAKKAAASGTTPVNASKSEHTGDSATQAESTNETLPSAKPEVSEVTIRPEGGDGVHNSLQAESLLEPLSSQGVSGHEESAPINTENPTYEKSGAKIFLETAPTALFAEDDRQPGATAAAIYGLSCIDGLGRSGVRALYRALGGRIDLVWSHHQSFLESVLAKARVPHATAIADLISEEGAKWEDKGLRLMEKYAERQIHLLTDDEFPEPFLRIPDAPSWLFVEGNSKALFNGPFVGIVGTRTASPEGIRATSVLARILSPYPVTIVSGLAEGIDEEAHRATLAEGKTNVAFLGHGIDVIFPASTSHLRAQIVASGGAVVTEYLPAERYAKAFFVQRNRLQAALCDVLIPVEAQVKSGTAHTIDFARKYGKPIKGIRWNGPTELLDALVAAGNDYFSINSKEGRKEVDLYFQEIVNRTGVIANPLANIINYAKREASNRTFNSTQFDDFIDALRQELSQGLS